MTMLYEEFKQELLKEPQIKAFNDETDSAFLMDNYFLKRYTEFLERRIEALEKFHK